MAAIYQLSFNLPIEDRKAKNEKMKFFLMKKNKNFYICTACKKSSFEIKWRGSSAG
ncbi:MAG: hypothetical protein JXR22_09285 [Prolixibacteraceae bacterium]|nr:hypothetical protein [Prolixibacteraceae bacterium]